MQEVYYLNGLGKWKYTVPFPVTTIYRFEKGGFGRSAGDVYFGTTNGVYLAKMGSWRADTKINGIDEEIVSIQTDRGHENSVHIKTISGKVCFLDANGTIGWYNNIPYPVTTIYRFEKGGFGRSAGDVYFGTTNGIYLSTAQNNWINPSKINNGINNAVAEIKDVNDNYNSVFVRTNNGEAYYLNGRGELSKYNVPFPVTTIYRFEKSGAGRNVGDVYFGTTNGVYLAKMGSWTADTKINGINKEIVSIQKDRENGNSVLIKTITGNVCFLDGDGKIGWYNIPYPGTSIYRFEKGTGKYGINDGDVYIGTSNGLYLSKAGNNWNTLSKIDLQNNHDEL
ncbi:hypothetical protein [Spiroplasma endosymbiont of Asaphidion curtum]|uniref:hypothetical protein n=1 Tax=Spiroplasma endosymbiont of Asaphidion curtum TaxID=3066281 RepID=UPI00313F08B1